VHGARVGGLLAYLFGPGRANEHLEARLVASWDGHPDELQPGKDDAGRHRIGNLAGLLEQPLTAVRNPLAKPVWHCALRTAPGDRQLSDGEWAEVATEVLNRTGLAPRGDDAGCRWVAVRHADDHIHLVVTLARQDGRRASTSNDYYKLGTACRWAEDRYGLTVTAPRDRTAPKRPTRAEIEKASREKESEPARVRLRREVRAAVAAAGDEEQFLGHLRSAGLLVRPRYSQFRPGEITGYAVAVPGDRNGSGQPVWFGGATLSADLSWTRLARRWHPTGQRFGGALRSEGSTTNIADRHAAWARATYTAARGAQAIRDLAAVDPARAGDAAHATADALAATARAVEGSRGGPLTHAAAAYERASCELWARTPHRTPTGDGLRATARLLGHAGRVRHDETAQTLALVTQLIALTEAVAHLRRAQGRATQAVAARDAADLLRRIAPERRAPVESRHPLLVPAKPLTVGRRRA
jgi:hypothetical protein